MPDDDNSKPLNQTALQDAARCFLEFNIDEENADSLKSLVAAIPLPNNAPQSVRDTRIQPANGSVSRFLNHTYALLKLLPEDANVPTGLTYNLKNLLKAVRAAARGESLETPIVNHQTKKTHRLGEFLNGAAVIMDQLIKYIPNAIEQAIDNSESIAHTSLDTSLQLNEYQQQIFSQFKINAPEVYETIATELNKVQTAYKADINRGSPPIG